MGALKFRLGPFPVIVEPTFLLIVVLLAISGASIREIVAFAVIAFVSVLAHELAHAIAFRRFGSEARITLHAFGGYTMPTGPPLTNAQSIVTTLVGPLVGVAIGLPLLFLEIQSPLGDLAFMAAVINLTWAIYNLLPIFPLDGGQALRSLLGKFVPSIAEPASCWISIGAAVAVALWAFTHDLFFAGVLTASFGVTNLNELRELRQRKLIPALRGAAERLDAGDAEGAITIARDLLARSSTGEQIRASASSVLAWSLLDAGRHAEASTVIQGFAEDDAPSEHLRAAADLASGHAQRGIERLAGILRHPNAGLIPTLGRVLVRTGNGREAEERLSQIGDASERRIALANLQLLLHVGGAYEDAHRLGLSLFAEEAEPWTAYNTARSATALGRLDEGIEWLRRAADGRFDHLAELAQDPDLAPLRADPRYEAIRRDVARNAGTPRT